MTDENQLSGPEFLKQFEDNWRTDIGAAIVGKERVVLRGIDFLSTCNTRTWAEHLVFAITGKHLKQFSRLVEAMWVTATSFPDPRLWVNRVAALGGTARTTCSLASNAASSIGEADAYGVRVGIRAINVLYRFKEKLDTGSKLEDLIQSDLKTYKVVSGFGRPLTSKDERIEPLLNFAKSLGYGNGPYVKLAFEIDNYFQNSRYPFQMNVSALMSALFADEGITAEDAYYLVIHCFLGGIYPCYIDAKSHPEGSFFPLSSTRIKYSGEHFHRAWQNS